MIVLEILAFLAAWFIGSILLVTALVMALGGLFMLSDKARYYRQRRAFLSCPDFIDAEALDLDEAGQDELYGACEEIAANWDRPAGGPLKIPGWPS